MKTPWQTLLTRLALAYALLIGGLPVLQGTAYVSGGWTESRFLLALFLFLPLAAAWLVYKGQSRPGAILMLGSMSSGVIINGLLLEGLQPPDFASAQWVIVLRVWILLLMVTNIALAATAFRILRDVHRTLSSHDQPTTT